MILEEDEVFCETLNMILNMTIFMNVQGLLVECDILEMVAQAASRALAKSDKDSGLVVLKVLNNLLFTPDLSSVLIQQDYIPILIDVLGISDNVIQRLYKCYIILILTRNCHNLTRIFTPGINWV